MSSAKKPTDGGKDASNKPAPLRSLLARARGIALCGAERFVAQTDRLATRRNDGLARALSIGGLAGSAYQAWRKANEKEQKLADKENQWLWESVDREVAKINANKTDTELKDLRGAVENLEKQQKLLLQQLEKEGKK